MDAVPGCRDRCHPRWPAVMAGHAPNLEAFRELARRNCSQGHQRNFGLGGARSTEQLGHRLSDGQCYDHDDYGSSDFGGQRDPSCSGDGTVCNGVAHDLDRRNGAGERASDDHARQQCEHAESVSVQHRRVIVEPVDIPELHLAWRYVQPLLLPSMQYGAPPYTVQDLYFDCIDGHASLWVAVRHPDVIGACIVAVDRWRSERILSLRVGGSTNMRACARQLLKAVEDWGRAHGCTRMTFSGRRGWARVLGAEVVGYCMTKDL